MEVCKDAVRAAEIVDAASNCFHDLLKHGRILVAHGKEWRRLKREALIAVGRWSENPVLLQQAEEAGKAR